MFGPNGMISFKENCDRIPDYDFAFARTRISSPFQAKYASNGAPLFVYYSVMIVTLKLFRHPGYYVYSVVLPLFLLNLYTISIFFTDFGLSSKINFLVTLLLAIFTFTFSIRESIPSVPYLTGLEKQITLSILILFIALVEVVMANFISSKEMEYVTYAIIGLDVGIVILYIIIFFMEIYSYKKRTWVFAAENIEFDNNQAKVQAVQDFDWDQCHTEGKDLLGFHTDRDRPIKTNKIPPPDEELTTLENRSEDEHVSLKSEET